MNYKKNAFSHTVVNWNEKINEGVSQYRNNPSQLELICLIMR